MHGTRSRSSERSPCPVRSPRRYYSILKPDKIIKNVIGIGNIFVTVPVLFHNEAFTVVSPWQESEGEHKSSQKVHNAYLNEEPPRDYPAVIQHKDDHHCAHHQNVERYIHHMELYSAKMCTKIMP